MEIPRLSFVVNEWLLFNAKWLIFQLYHDQNKLILNEMIMMYALYKTNRRSCILIVKQQSTGRHVAPLGHANESLLFLLNAAWFAERQHIAILKLFGLTWPGFEPTIYCTRGKHSNLYTSDAVPLVLLV